MTMRYLIAALIIALYASSSFAAQQEILGGVGVQWGSERAKINSNFTELYTRPLNSNAGTICSGSTTFLAGDTACYDLSTIFQPLDSDLTIYAGITPSANVQSYLASASYAAMRTLLGLDTSAGIASAVSDETGTGLLVFNNSPNITNPNITATDTRIGNTTDYIRIWDDSGDIKLSFEGNAGLYGGLASGSVTFSSLASDAKFQSIAVAGLSDPTTPSVLTATETTNKLISNYKTTGADHVFTLPTAHIAANVVFMIGDEFQVDIEPPSGAALYLNGTVMAVDQHIVNSADTLAEHITCITANLNGTLTWMCESKYLNWVEATP